MGEFQGLENRRNSLSLEKQLLHLLKFFLPLQKNLILIICLGPQWSGRGGAVGLSQLEMLKLSLSYSIFVVSFKQVVHQTACLAYSSNMTHHKSYWLYLESDESRERKFPPFVYFSTLRTLIFNAVPRFCFVFFFSPYVEKFKTNIVHTANIFWTKKCLLCPLNPKSQFSPPVIVTTNNYYNSHFGLINNVNNNQY